MGKHYNRWMRVCLLRTIRVFSCTNTNAYAGASAGSHAGTYNVETDARTDTRADSRADSFR
jgi:hypothetical protein